MGGRHLQPYAIDMRTFLEEYSHLTENGNVDFTRFTRLTKTGGGCPVPGCGSNPPFSLPPPSNPTPAAPTRPCENVALEGQYYELQKLLGKGPYNVFNGRYNVTWDICNPLPFRCGAACAPGTAAVCTFDTAPPTEYSCVPFIGGRATKYTPTANGGVNAPNATIGAAILFGDGEVDAAKINVFCNETAIGTPYLFQVPPRVEVQIFSSAGCPRALPPVAVPARAPSANGTAPTDAGASSNLGTSNIIAIAIFIPLIVIFIVIIIVMAVIIYRRKNPRGGLIGKNEKPLL